MELNVDKRLKTAKFARRIFLESKTNVETCRKHSPYFGVFYKFLLKSVKSVNRTFSAMGYWFKALYRQICQWMQNYFSGKCEAGYIGYIYLILFNIQHSTVEYSTGHNVIYTTYIFYQVVSLSSAWFIGAISTLQ